MEPGTKVHSKQVGRRKAFDGKIKLRIGSHSYIVSDEDGKLWYRNQSELVEIEDPIEETS